MARTSKIYVNMGTELKEQAEEVLSHLGIP